MTGTVVVQPAGVEIVVEDGESLMRAAERLGYRWPTICGGQGTCRTCFVQVDEGLAHCSGIGGLEREGIAALRRPVDGRTRLACQLRVTGGPVTVTRRGVRRRTEGEQGVG
ncbi:2Fe-2S iron-sulfur cluster-binding protein [Actinomadura rudentiformis]|uniref:2Fe-2S iron-sulfur cluster binding domain-containing protein n=1 Tax=Actinomadura rudentiformis TaxID=359158 RepID=A0A6H9YFG9_9ACTN|nr:2Fe-2S iron-sulfur cluster binding domain-containing protein [Actinomadura rudentiformis]KAB2340379.1 2Fe-2S iron-sulfur cluster binding domain-containing protein [Actinomadura rudentiformis]